MNDEFLSLLREPPRREYVQQLQRRFAHLASQETTAGSRWGFRLPSRRLAISALAAILLVIAVALAGSRSVQAMLAKVIHVIGGVSYEESEQYVNAPSPAETQSAITRLRLAELQAVLPFPLRLPRWAPRESVLDGEGILVAQYPPGGLETSLLLSWKDSSGDETAILIILYPVSGISSVGAGPAGSVTEATVNGQSAALIRGSWDQGTQEWSPGARLGLSWAQDKVLYQLYTWRSGITAEDLIRMAESVQ